MTPRPRAGHTARRVAREEARCAADAGPARTPRMRARSPQTRTARPHAASRSSGLGLQRRRSRTRERPAAASAEAHRCRRCSRGASAARGRRVPGQLQPTSSGSGKALSGTGAVEATRSRLGAVHTPETDRQPARAEPGRPVGPGSQSVCISPLRRLDAANLTDSCPHFLALRARPPPFRFFRGWGGSQNYFKKVTKYYCNPYDSYRH